MKKNSNLQFNDLYSFLNSESARKVDNVNIHGFGLTPNALKLLDSFDISYHPVEDVTGIIDISLPDLSERTPWILSGSYQGDNVSNIQLITPDGSRHDCTLSDTSFKVTTIAPVAGEYLLQLEMLLNNGDTISEELPIKIPKEASWNMLVLSGFPTFEINYLKNYWTSLENGFALRTKISKARFQTTFINLAKTNLDRLNKNTIEQYDLIMTDVSSWNQLSSRERSNILQAVRDEGVGLMLRPDQNEQSAIGINHPKWSEPHTFKLQTSNDEIALVRYPFSGSGWRPLDMEGMRLGRFRSEGLGHIFMLGIGDTYKLILVDESSQYQEIWAYIFSSLHRNFSSPYELIAPFWIWENEKTDMQIIADVPIEENIILNDSVRLPILTTPFISGSYEVSVWPRKGYNNIKIPHMDATLSFYAHSTGVWSAVRQMYLAKATRIAQLKQAGRHFEIDKSLKEIRFFWWYIMILAGFSALWLDETFTQ